MKIREAFLLAVLLLFNEVQANQNGASLNSLIQELAPIARLTNGIAIQTELSKDSNKMNELVAEFLGVGSGDDVARLKQLKVDEVAKELGELYATVEKVPELNVDMAALANSFNALETMKQGSAVLGKTNLTNPEVDLQKDIDKAKTLIMPKFDVKFEEFKTAAEKLKFIKPAVVGDVGNVVNGYLVPLKTSVETIREQMEEFENSEIKWPSLFKLQDINERLADVRAITNVLNPFAENFASFSSMGGQLIELKTEVNNLKSVNDMVKSKPNLAKSMAESSDAIKTLSSKPPIRLTAGFSGGVGDLKLMMEDFKSGKLKKLVSQGKDMKDIQKALSSLANIHEPLQLVQKAWNQVSSSKNQGVQETVAKMLSDLLTSAENVTDTESIIKSLSIEECFKDLKQSQNPPDQEKVSHLLSYGKKLSDQIGAFKKLLQNKKADFQVLSTKMISLSTVLDPIEKNVGSTVSNTIWESIQNRSDIDELVNSLITIHGELKVILDQNPFKTVRKAVELKVIPTVLSSLDGTNVKEMLDCLQKTNYNSAELDSTLSFGKSVQEMKNKTSEVEAVTAFLTDLTKVKTGLLEIQKQTPSVQKPKPRRRRAPNQKSLANLKTTVATDFGRGVQVLREFTKILENEASVKVAVEADDDVKNAISAIPGVQSVWTDDNRKGMGKMVVDLNDLDKYALTLKKDNMTSLWMIFDEAQKIQGVEIADAKVFEDPISIALAMNSDAKIKGTSGDFKNLGALELDFAQHRNHLKAASYTLQPLQQFFDDYFGNSKTSGSAQAAGQLATTEPTDPTIYIIVSGAIVGVLAFGSVLGGAGYYAWKKSNAKKKWENREAYWLHEYVLSKPDEHGALLPLLAREGRVQSVKEAIAEGRCLDMYRCFIDRQPYAWQTALHGAATSMHPEIVEMLILAGADRTLLSSTNRTAEDVLDILIKWSKTTEKQMEALKKTKAIFEKYRQQQFRSRHIGKMMSTDQISIQILLPNAETEPLFDAFTEKFPNMLFIHDESMSNATHFVFETHSDGCLDLDTLHVPTLYDPLRLNRFLLLFSKRLPVRMSWLEACLKDPKNFHKDYEYQITTVQYCNRIYSTCVEWRKWLLLRKVPCLFNVDITFFPYRKETTENFKNIVTKLGGNYMSIEALCSRPVNEEVKAYWFPAKAQRWIIYEEDKLEELEKTRKAWQADPNSGWCGDWKLDYFKSSVEEFLRFLLSMNGPERLEPRGVMPELTAQGLANSKTASK